MTENQTYNPSYTAAQLPGDVTRGGTTAKGYFASRLLDNFKWTAGCKTRLGLVHLDDDAHEQTRKASGPWCTNVARSQESARKETAE